MWDPKGQRTEDEGGSCNACGVHGARAPGRKVS